MNDQCLGTCSLCGGRVMCPLIFWSVVPPVPTCERCGATPRDHGPVIEMEPRRYGDPFRTYTSDRVVFETPGSTCLPDVVCGGQRLPKTVFR